jgi:hypothetical protein
MIEPVVKRITEEFPTLQYKYVDDLETLKQLNITVVPTVIAMKCESEHARLEDIQDQPTYRAMFESLSNDQ